MSYPFDVSNQLRFSKKASPMLVAAIVGFTLAGCNSPVTPAVNMNDGSVQSSVNNVMTDKSSSSPDTMQNSSATSEVSMTNKKYKDGTYSADGSYVSPAGNEQVSVTLTLKDGLIASSQFTGKAEGGASKKWQSAFAGGYSAMVVGKSIDEVALDVVSGSSLTPKGFMDAVNQIKTQAKA